MFKLEAQCHHCNNMTYKDLSILSLLYLFSHANSSNNSYSFQTILNIKRIMMFLNFDSFCQQIIHELFQNAPEAFFLEIKFISYLRLTCLACLIEGRHKSWLERCATFVQLTHLQPLEYCTKILRQCF